MTRTLLTLGALLLLSPACDGNGHDEEDADGADDSIEPGEPDSADRDGTTDEPADPADGEEPDAPDEALEEEETDGSLPAMGPLVVHPDNPRYFTDGSGRVVYLTGSHTWSNLQSWGTLHPTIDFTAYLEWLQARNHNCIRLWVTDTAWREGEGEGPCEPQPFVRTGPGDAIHGGLKFDLNELNQAYFDELYRRVSSARDHGMYVIVMLFDVWGVGGYGNLGEWRGSPFHADNNVNGIDGDTDGDGRGTEVFTLQADEITAIQEPYVLKVIDTLDGLDNVLYEIINEGDDSTYDWQVHFIDFIKNAEATRSMTHPVGINTLSLPLQVASDAEFISPLGLGPDAPYAVSPPAADGSKVVVVDTDHIEYPRDTDDLWIPAVWVWKSFMRGLNPIFMDHAGAVTGLTDRPGSENARQAMGHTRMYAGRMDLAAMLPRDDLSSTAYCLASPGSEYLVYQPDGGGFTATLSAGTYAYEWFDPVAGTVSESGSITVDDGTTSFEPPFDGQAILYLGRM